MSTSLAYELPADLMAEYDCLMNKKFDEGLTPDEEAEFARVAKALSDADMATPLGQAIMRQARLNDAVALERVLALPSDAGDEDKHRLLAFVRREIDALRAELEIAIPFIPRLERS